MGQQSSINQALSHQIDINPQTLQFNTLLIKDSHTHHIQPFPLCHKKKSLSIRKQKKHRIFQEWIPLSLPLVSKNSLTNNPSISQQQSNLNQQKTNQKNYFSQKYMKNSFFVFENVPSRKVPKIQKFSRQSDENQNPNRYFVSIQKDIQTQTKFRKTQGAPVKRSMHIQSDYESVVQKKVKQKSAAMNDSIINQWFEASQVKDKWMSEVDPTRRRGSKNKKCKVQKASVIFSKNISKHRNKSVKDQIPLSENQILINITNLALLESRD